MALISLRQLLECGVHFGHPTRKWNPKMAPFIYTKRNGIHILDLQQTTKFIDVVHAYVQELIGEGKTILFVGTKKQAQDAIREEATKCGMPYVHQRWLGGLLTNRPTIAKRIERLRTLRQQKEEGYFDTLTKKDKKTLEDQLEKLEKLLGGVGDLDLDKKLPDALFIVDVKKEVNAVKEAKKLSIPIIGILDTNCDPDDVDYKLPGNDDAIRSIRLFCQIIADSVMEAKYGYLPPDSVFIKAAEEAGEKEERKAELERKPEAARPDEGETAEVPSPTLAAKIQADVPPVPETAFEPGSPDHDAGAADQASDSARMPPPASPEETAMPEPQLSAAEEGAMPVEKEEADSALDGPSPQQPTE